MDGLPSPRAGQPIDHAVRPPIDQFEEVLAQVEIVDEAGAAAGPRSVGYHLVEPEDLRPLSAAVEVVDPHRPVDEVPVEPGAVVILSGGARGKDAAPVRGAGHEDGRDRDGCPARN